MLSDDKVKFGFDKAELSDEAKAALDEFAAQLKTENKNVYVEVQGHTDNVGGEIYNEKLGEQRAEAVEEYLAKQGIPLFRMESISYGESAPVADNKTREGRAPEPPRGPGRPAVSKLSQCGAARDGPVRVSGSSFLPIRQPRSPAPALDQPRAARRSSPQR